MKSVAVKNFALADIQQEFAAVVMNPLTASWQTARTTESGRKTREIAESIIEPNEILTSLDRLEIYNKQYWFRLVDCLYDDFPGLLAVLGQKSFNRVILSYLKIYPSSSYSLRDLGAMMPKYIEEHQELSGKRYKAALDMVRFEWAQIQAFDGAAWDPIDPTLLTDTGDPANLKFHLQPYLSLVEMSYPFDDFVLALKRSQASRSEAGVTELREIQEGARHSLPKKQDTYVVVHRLDNALYYKRLEKPGFYVLRAIQEGATLGEAVGAGAGCLSATKLAQMNFAESVREWFTTWSTLRWFCIPAAQPDGEIS